MDNQKTEISFASAFRLVIIFVGLLIIGNNLHITITHESFGNGIKLQHTGGNSLDHRIKVGVEHEGRIDSR